MKEPLYNHFLRNENPIPSAAPGSRQLARLRLRDGWMATLRRRRTEGSGKEGPGTSEDRVGQEQALNVYVNTEAPAVRN